MKLSNSMRSGNRLLIACAAVLAAAVALPKAAHAGDIIVPTVPADVRVDAPNEVFLVGHAQGTQNYVCLPSGTGVAYVLFTPEATLFNNDGDKALITHFFSPNPDEKNTNPALTAIGPIRATWQGSKDSSTVWAAASGVSTDAHFVAPNSVPWVRLTAVGWGFGPDGGDLLSHVTFVQRLNTHGGVAPLTGCASTADIGHLAFMPYTADYFFYTSPDAP
jgi:hypothetical protein